MNLPLQSTFTTFKGKAASNSSYPSGLSSVYFPPENIHSVIFLFCNERFKKSTVKRVSAASGIFPYLLIKKKLY